MTLKKEIKKASPVRDVSNRVVVIMLIIGLGVSVVSMITFIEVLKEVRSGFGASFPATASPLKDNWEVTGATVGESPPAKAMNSSQKVKKTS